MNTIVFNPKDIERFSQYKKYEPFKLMVERNKILSSEKIKEFTFSEFSPCGRCVARGVIPLFMREGIE